ncbi:PREDICTED: leucine-rich repeat-containing protein 14-like, partial [Pterocles gutturalis]
FRRALDFLPAELYPVLIQAAVVDGRKFVVRDLGGTWPFPILSFHWVLDYRECHYDRPRRRRPIHLDDPKKSCMKAVILGVMAHLRRELEGPWHGTRRGRRFPPPSFQGFFSSPSERRCRLRVVDMTSLQTEDEENRVPDTLSSWSITDVLAKACIEVFKNHTAFLKRCSKQRKGSSGASAAPRSIQVEVLADLYVAGDIDLVCDALRIAAVSPLCLKCRDFHAENLSFAHTLDLVQTLDPAGIRRLDLCFNDLDLRDLCGVLVHVTRFTDLLSLKISYAEEEPEMMATRAELQGLSALLGRLTWLKELNLTCCKLSGKLRHALSEVQVPLESLELPVCSLLPNDLAFLSQSIHAPALKKLDLNYLNFSDAFLQPLRDLLEEASASLLHLDLTECRLTDSRLEALLPVLCRCSRLRCLGLCGNPLSSTVLKTLLQETVILRDLRLVYYPYPMDCRRQNLPPPPSASHCVLWHDMDQEHFAVVKAELRRMLVDSGRADIVWTDKFLNYKAVDYFVVQRSLEPSSCPEAPDELQWLHRCAATLPSS